MAKRSPPISETEMEVLRALWALGSGTVREVDSRLRAARRRWAYTTVLTLLHRLETKGYVERDASGFAHVFRATVTRDVLLRRRLVDLADQLCDGATSPLVMALVEQHQFSEEEISEFRRLLDNVERSESPRETRKPRRRGDES